MTLFRQNKEQEDQYQYDESIFRPRPDTRMQLPGDEELVFAEEQQFDQIWLWAVMGIELLIVMIPLIITGQPWWSWIVAASAIMLTMALLGSMKLKTRIDSEGVHFMMKVFHWKERTILWDDIDQIYVRKYSAISEYGGWGIKYGRSGKAFNVRGNHGIQIVKKDGKKILLGTQRPEDAAHHLNQHPLLV
jgi:hypothetical protein